MAIADGMSYICITVDEGWDGLFVKRRMGTTLYCRVLS